MVSQDTVAEYFGILDDLLRKSRFQVLVAVIPRFPRSFHAYPLGAQHAYARELAERHRFHFVDLLDAFSSCRDTSTVPVELDYFHPSAYGHRCAAEALAGGIQEGIARR